MAYKETAEKLLSDCPRIPIEKLKAVKKIITHGGKCPDGRASAIILKRAFGIAGLNPEIVFVVHGTKEHEELQPEEGLLFCDFCVPEKNWQPFLDAGTIVLDHHKGVKDIVQKFVEAEQGAFADEKDHPGISGASLAYEYVFVPLAKSESGITVPEGSVFYELGRIAGIRDTWQKNDPEWHKACEQGEALGWWPEEYILDPDVKLENLLELGPILWEKKQKSAQKVAERAYRFTTKQGTRVALFQGMRMSSDTSEALGDEVDLVIGYDLMWENGQYKMGFSTRSRTTYDCKSLAQAHGGGGHTRAAGFGVPLNVKKAPNPVRVADLVVNAYEGSLVSKLQKWWSL